MLRRVPVRRLVAAATRRPRPAPSLLLDEVRAQGQTLRLIADQLWPWSTVGIVFAGGVIATATVVGAIDDLRHEVVEQTRRLDAILERVRETPPTAGRAMGAPAQS